MSTIPFAFLGIFTEVVCTFQCIFFHKLDPTGSLCHAALSDGTSSKIDSRMTVERHTQEKRRCNVRGNSRSNGSCSTSVSISRYLFYMVVIWSLVMRQTIADNDRRRSGGSCHADGILWISYSLDSPANSRATICRVTERGQRCTGALHGCHHDLLVYGKLSEQTNASCMRGRKVEFRKNCRSVVVCAESGHNL